ncbi:MAG: ptpA 3 [Bacteroidetes bacterium]|nr:ptpA 3 [Bacteroidota bacterium]
MTGSRVPPASHGAAGAPIATAIALVLLSLSLALTLPAPVSAQARRPLRIEDLYKAKRISDVALSPDGRLVAYTLTTSDLDANRNSSDVWVVSVDGKRSWQVTDHPSNDRHPVWSPDGQTIAFESARAGSTQIWLASADGGQARQFTTLSTGASQPVWSPDGSRLAFVSEVFPEFANLPFAASDSLNRQTLDRKGNAPVRAEVFTRLLYRHWDHWVGGKRQHIFIQALAGGEPRNLTPGDRDAVPSSSTFSDAPDFAFTPDGREIVYTATPVPAEEEAWRTNHDLYAVAVTGGPPRQLTANPAADGAPRFSPDGRHLVYRAQSRPGFEADRWQLMLMDRDMKAARPLTGSFDASVSSPQWSADSREIYFLSDDRAEVGIFSVGIDGGPVRKVFGTGSNTSIGVLPDGRGLVFSHATAIRPAEICLLPAGGVPGPVTRVNDGLFDSLDIPAPKSFTYAGDGGTPVQGWLFYPAGFDPTKKYPLVMLVHGGPQGAWENGWSYRWNPALWAAQGYVVFAPNPRGSTGFGQAFVDGVSRDWGGAAFGDLVRGLDTVSTFPYVDPRRIGAAGASFGGYMANWFQAKIPERFAVLVTHNGIYNLASAYGTTEELWFDEWERGGTPYDSPANYMLHSPSTYAKNFRTPHLVIHGAFDFRIDEGEAMQMFTALQRHGVPSKYLYFPDENHWVLKPANSRFWHQTVFGWLAHYLHPEEARP